MTSRLFHLAIRDEWDAACAGGGTYERSTLGLSLAEVGFIHSSFAGQVQGVADRFYRGRDDVVLLVIDPEQVAAEIRVEDLAGTGEAFPHIYGPLPIDAVVAIHHVRPGADGRLAIDARWLGA